MKKILRKDLQGLRCQFPVLTEKEMKCYVGGYSDGYFGGGLGYGGDDYGNFGGSGGSGYSFDDWISSGNYFYDKDGNFFWSTGNYFTDPYGNSFFYDGGDSDIYHDPYTTGYQKSDCTLWAISSITGLSYEKLYGLATQMFMDKLNISRETANIFAQQALGVDEIETLLRMAGGDCYNVYINENENTTFNNSIGLMDRGGPKGKHVVKVLYYDSYTKKVYYADWQSGAVNSDSLSSFISIKSFNDNL